jgi:hypothetical protein
MSAVGMTEEDIGNRNMAKVFGIAFIFELIIAFNLAIFLTGSPKAAEQMTTQKMFFMNF